MTACREAFNLTAYYTELFQSLVGDLAADSSCCFSTQTRSFSSTASHPACALITQQQVDALLRLIGYENLRGICDGFCVKIKEHIKSVEDAFDNLRGNGLLSEDAPVQRAVLSNIWTDLYQIGIMENVLATLESRAQEVCAQMSWSITPFCWGLQTELEKKDTRTPEQESLLGNCKNMFLTAPDASVLGLARCRFCVDSCCDCLRNVLKSVPTLISSDELVVFLMQIMQIPT